jgi:hypothetical protein
MTEPASASRSEPRGCHLAGRIQDRSGDSVRRLGPPEADGRVRGPWRAYACRSSCSGSLNEFPVGSRPYASLEIASLHFLAPRGGTDDRSLEDSLS